MWFILACICEFLFQFQMEIGIKNNYTCLIALTIIKTIQITNTIIPITIRMFPIVPAGYGIGA